MKVALPRWSTPKAVFVLLAMVLLVVLLTPEASEFGGAGSSFSSASTGTRVVYELARRMGWQVTRRVTTLDSVAEARNVEVVLNAREYLGAKETHLLLERVRRGGGLVFSMDGGGEIADSLGMG